MSRDHLVIKEPLVLRVRLVQLVEMVCLVHLEEPDLVALPVLEVHLDHVVHLVHLDHHHSSNWLELMAKDSQLTTTSEIVSLVKWVHEVSLVSLDHVVVLVIPVLKEDKAPLVSEVSLVHMDPRAHLD